MVCMDGSSDMSVCVVDDTSGMCVCVCVGR